MDVVTRLIVLHIDYETGSNRCLFDDDGQFPSKTIPDLHQPVQLGSTILEEYLEIKPDWVSFALIDVEVDKNNTLFIYYTCMVPAIIKNNKGKWINVGDIQDGDVKKIVFKAGQETLARL